jgi:serine/threonine protein phosphatase PrpC
VFASLDNKFLETTRATGSSSGAACLLALIYSGKLTIANLGDCVATLVSKEGRINKLSVEQDLNRADEIKRIAN